MITKQRYTTISSITVFSILFMIANWNGINLTPDSWAYLGAANSISDHLSLPKNYINWPPLYPFLLSISSEKSIAVWTLSINFISISISLILWVSIGFKYLKKEILLILFAITITISTPILANTHFIWSESFFILLISIFLFSLINLNKNKLHHYLFFISGIMMCYQKNTALFFLAGLFISTLIQKNRNLSIKVLIIIALGSFWNIYQILINSNDELVSDLIPYLDLFRNLTITLNELSSWYFPSSGFAIISILFMLIIFIFILKSKLNHKNIIGAISFYTLCFIIIPASVDDIARLLSVLFFPFTFFLFYMIDQLKINRKIIIIVLSLSISYQSFRVLKNALKWNKSGSFEISKNSNQ